MTDLLRNTPTTPPDQNRCDDEPVWDLEREKITIERERLALERERLVAEREKWRAEAVWKERSEGRLGISPFTLLTAVCGFFILGMLLGVSILGRQERRRPGLDRQQMSRMILDAMQTTTNSADQAQGLFLLRALSAPPAPPPSGGERLMIK